MKKLLFPLLFFYFLYGQTEPTKGIHQNNPRVWALSHAKIHTEPGDSIKPICISGNFLLIAIIKLCIILLTMYL